MRIIFLALCLLSMSFLTAQSPWKQIDESTIQDKIAEREIIPSTYYTYNLDIDRLRASLEDAPMEDMQDTRKRGIVMDLPLADGTMGSFDFIESPCMSPVLSAKFPDIKSYHGYCIEEDGSYARIDISNSGLRGAILSQSGTMYIDPYYTEADGSYISYYVVDDKVEIKPEQRTCSYTAYEARMAEETLKKKNGPLQSTKKIADPVIKTTYRMALACTGIWGTQQGGTVSGVMAKMNSGINRLNMLLEDEVAIKFELIDDNENLIFFNETEQYNEPRRGRSVLAQNTAVLNQWVGEGSYDIGHVFTTACTDSIGGVANGSSVCGTNKGAGVSCVGRSNLNNFMISTTAHEIGHQFSAGHTWNNCPPVAGQFAYNSACEPGSGVTILSYLGACTSNNSTGREINLYHVCTINEFKEFITYGAGGTCGNHEVSDNHHPDVWIDQPGGFSIPIATPFELTGDASDADGDEMLYTWEQIDIDFSATLGNPTGNSPTFRYFEPSTEKTRIFPRLSNVLDGNDWREERLPTYDREFNFNFVARDDNPLAGGVNWATITFEASASAGPFVVREPSTFVSTQPGKTITVEWDVANTDNEIVDCQFVDIYFSADGAMSFPFLLKSRTANDGSEIVNIPNSLTQDGRIKVKGSGNVFFNIGRGSIQVQEPSAPSFYVDTEVKSFDICLPESVQTTINATSLLGFDEMINLEIISGLPAEATHTFSQNPMPADGSSQLDIDLSQVLNQGVYNVIVQATAPNADTLEMHLSISAKGTYIDDFKATNPASGTTGILTLPEFAWSGSANANGYRLELASNPSFSPESILLQEEMGVATTSSIKTDLENSTLYYWRVIAYVPCLGEVASETFTLATQALSCADYIADDVPQNIPSGGTPTIESKIRVDGAGKVTDVNVSSIKGNHSVIQQLSVKLVSPSGKEVKLFEGECLSEETFHAAFDDAASRTNGCPSIGGEKMLPLEPLSSLAGEDINGLWTLRVSDIISGNGGTLSEFNLNLCSDSALDNPFLVNNEILSVAPGKSNFVKKDELLSRDNNNTAEQLIYTIVVLPLKGNLEMNGAILETGDQFSQTDLDGNRVRYRHSGNTEDTDSFVFTVIDGEGGWIDKTTFLINIVEGGSTDVTDIASTETLFDIFPNPANAQIFVEQKAFDNKEWNLQLIGVDGKVVHEERFTNETRIATTKLQSGMYILQLKEGQNILTKKISVIK